MALSPKYHFMFTQFCLNTHFIRGVDLNASLNDRHAEGMKRSLHSAMAVLRLSSKLGPARRDQLRYSGVFFFRTISFCSTFVLQATRLFPALTPCPSQAKELVKQILVLMSGLGVDRDHATYTAKQLLLRELDATARQGHSNEALPTLASVPLTPAESDPDYLKINDWYDGEVTDHLDHYYTDHGFDLLDLFE